jgi:hypothetical protein
MAEAHEGASSLQEHIEQQLERDSDLASRLQHLELSPDDIELRGLTLSEPSADRDRNSEKGRSSRPPTPLDPPRDGRASPDTDNTTRQAFDEILSESRVYTRVQHLEMDATSTILTTRSRAWSVLSGISLAQISTVAVIKLPLHEPELRRFWNLASPSAMSSATTVTEQAATRFVQMPADLGVAHLSDEVWLRTFGLIQQKSERQDGGSLKRIKKELANINRDPPSSASAGPISNEHGDDLVSNPFLANNLKWGYRRLTNITSITGWRLSWAR